MKHTLVAAFDNFSDADKVKTALINHGIAHTHINVHAAETDSSTGMASSTSGLASDDTAGMSAESSTGLAHDTSATHVGHHDESMGDKISNFFGSLFGGGDDDNLHRRGAAYPEAYRRGSTLVTVSVDTDEAADEVEDIMERNGAIDIDERSASWTADDATSTSASHISSQADTEINDSASAAWPTDVNAAALATHTATDTSMPLTDASMPLTDTPAEHHEGQTAIPVMEESLKVGKRETNTGRVRVVSRVTERPVEETVSLREERADIQRRAVDRAVEPGEMANFREGSIEIQETAEEPVIEKTARVVEEVLVGTKTTHRDETVRDTVRRTDVDIATDAHAVHTDNELIGERHLHDETDPLKSRH